MSNNENKVTATQSWNKNPNLPSDEWFPHNPAILDEYGNKLSYEALLKEFWNVLRDRRDLRMEKNERSEDSVEEVTLDSLVQKLAELTAEMNNYLVDNVSSDTNVTNAIIRDILHREAKDYPPFW